MFYKLNLLRFGDGGDGGASAGASASTAGSSEGAASAGETSGVEIPASIPERGRKLYAEVMKQQSAPVEEPKTETVVEPVAEPKKPTYEELIKSDEYKAAHKEYMERTISDRLKKYKGQEEHMKQADSILRTVGAKYGLDIKADDYMAKLASAIENDESFYEKYAEDHDMTPEAAKKVVAMENKLRELEETQAREREEEQRREQFRVIQENATKTQQRYPTFDLGTELQNPNFVRILSASNGDTTAAYIATHHDEIINGVAQSIAQQARAAATNAVVAGQSRPIENGATGIVPSEVSVDFSKMSLSELRAYADEQRRKKR